MFRCFHRGSQTVWPVRRCVKAAVRKGVGSDPTAVKCSNRCCSGVAGARIAFDASPRNPIRYARMHGAAVSPPVSSATFAEAKCNCEGISAPLRKDVGSIPAAVSCLNPCCHGRSEWSARIRGVSVCPYSRRRLVLDPGFGSAVSAKTQSHTRTARATNVHQGGTHPTRWPFIRGRSSNGRARA